MILKSPCRSVLAAVTVVVMLGASIAAAQTQAYRLTTLSLVEPHVFLPPLGCSDQTALVNSVISGEVTSCDKLDPNQPNAEPCELSLNLVAVFDPLNQTPGEGGALNFAFFSSCIRDGGVVDCAEAPSQAVPTTYTSEDTGVACLGAIPGTVGPRNMGSYTPPVATTTGPCFVTDVLNLEFNLGDINIPLEGAQIAAQYSGDPVTGFVNGLARGFLSAETAAAIILDFPPFLVDVQLSSLLKGGSGSTCTGDDRDFNPPDDMEGESGWWFYLAFTADPAEVPEIVVPTPTATTEMEDTPTATPPQPTDTATPVDTPTPTDTPTGPDTPTPTDTPTTPVSSMCPGDCDGSGDVPIEEVQTAAAIFLGAMPVSACPAADPDDSGSVFIFELQGVVNSFRLGCP